MRLHTDFRGKNANAVGGICKAIARVVLAENETAFGAAGEHAIWFVRSLCNQVVDENADIGILSAEDQRWFISDRKGGVDSGDDALCGRFFIAGGSVHLSGKIKSANTF